MEKLQNSILEIINFYSLFKKPLRPEEILESLSMKTSKEELDLAIANLCQVGFLEEKFGFFCSKGESKSAFLRVKRKKYNLIRWKKAAFLAKLVKFLPFVKMLAVINSVSFGVAKAESDIDILIVSRKNRLWTSRAFMVSLLEILGMNKQLDKVAERFCLSFAIDEKCLNLLPLKMEKDIYFPLWLANLYPVYDERIYNKIIKENSWLKEKLPNWEERNSLEKLEKKKNNKIQNFLEKTLSGKFGNWLEKFLMKIQIKRIWSDPKNHRIGGSVIAEKGMMKLHPYDKRYIYQKTFNQKMRNLFRTN